MICLVGFMGAGKSTAARSLSRDGLRTVDLDELLERREGSSVQSMFENLGEAGFRELEARTALEVLGDPSVEALALEGQVVDWVLTQVEVEDQLQSFQELMGPAA